MKFIVIEIDDGGATEVGAESGDAVIDYLGTSPFWKDALYKFRIRVWKPGEMMNYPCGWIFCVNDLQGE